MYLLRGFVAWAVMMAGETVLAVVRTLLLVPVVGDLRARQIGFFFGAALILAVACLFIRQLGARARGRLAAVGLEWAALTLLFELGLGRLVMGLSWERIIEDYDPSRGGLMWLGLTFLALCPLLASKLCGSRTKPGGHA
jgi:hypothetical protein